MKTPNWTKADVRLAEIEMTSLGFVRIPGTPLMVNRSGDVFGLTFGRRVKPYENGPIGYLRVSYSRNNKMTGKYVHRLVAEAFLPPPLNGQNQVRHLDGNHLNNDVGNLAWGTAKENSIDMHNHGRRRAGERHQNSKLGGKFLCALDMFRSGKTFTQIAEMLGVSRSTVSRACKGETQYAK